MKICRKWNGGAFYGQMGETELRSVGRSRNPEVAGKASSLVPAPDTPVYAQLSLSQNSGELEGVASAQRGTVS